MITILISRNKTRIGTLIVGLVFSVISGCDAGSGKDGTITVVATTSIWGDVAARVVGPDGEVVTLIPRGADAHDYQASPQQAASLREADLVVVNGLGLEEGLQEALSAAATDGANVLGIAPLLDPRPLGDGADPHVWFDPSRVAEAAQLIATRLVEIDPEVDWAARADAYGVELDELDVEIETILGVVEPERRKLVTNHDSLGYFADRYGFQVVGVVIPGGSTLSQPSSAQLAELVSRIEEEAVPAIFAETSSPTDLAEAVAAETDGVAVVELHTESLGAPDSTTGTLLGMLWANAERIADALG
jgi:zinc/manganese transport system substrate-binding protein